MYKYVGGDQKDIGLTIGGYESAFLSDLVVSMLFHEVEKKCFVNPVHRLKSSTIKNRKSSF